MDRPDWYRAPQSGGVEVARMLLTRTIQRCYPSHEMSQSQLFGMDRYDSFQKLLQEFSHRQTVERKGVNITISPQPFEVLNEQLFCSCCREILSVHKSTIVNHILSEKHMNNQKEFEDGQKPRQQLIDSWQNETKAADIVTLTDQEKDFRHDVLFSFLSGALPLHPAGGFAPWNPFKNKIIYKYNLI